MGQVVGSTGQSFTSFRTGLFPCSLHGFVDFTGLPRASSRHFKLRENLLVYFYMYEGLVCKYSRSLILCTSGVMQYIVIQLV